MADNNNIAATRLDDFSTQLVEAASLMDAHNNSPANNHNNMTNNNNNKWSKNGFGAPVRKQSGKFSRAETEQVRKAVEQFCHAKQIPTSRLCSECDHKAELKGAWMEIAKSLPHRSVQSVYRHGIRQLHPFKRGAWSEEECVLLADLVQKLGKKWSSIQNKINRSADSCRDKYREMSDEFVKGRWKEHDTEMLKRVIREQLNVPQDMDMRELGRLVDEQGIQIPWSVISKRMGNRSRLSCFKKWQKMSGVSSADDPTMKRERDNDDEIDGTDDLLHHHHHLHHTTHPHHQTRTANSKRAKMLDTKIEYPQAATAGAAAALAHHHLLHNQQQQQHHHHHHHHLHHPGAVGVGEDFYDARLAEETVEAVKLPDTDRLK